MATANQRSDLRLDMGLDDDETVFSNTEVDRLFVRAADTYDTTAEQEAYARVLACKQLRNKTSTLTDYQQNDSSEKLSQVFKHLDRMQTDFEADLVAVRRRNVPSMRVARMNQKPARKLEHPDA